MFGGLLLYKPGRAPKTKPPMKGCLNSGAPMLRPCFTGSDFPNHETTWTCEPLMPWAPPFYPNLPFPAVKVVYMSNVPTGFEVYPRDATNLWPILGLSPSPGAAGWTSWCPLDRLVWLSIAGFPPFQFGSKQPAPCFVSKGAQHGRNPFHTSWDG